MFKYTSKTIALSLYDSLIKHKKELDKEEAQDNIENWTNGIAGRLIKYAMEESYRYNTKNYSKKQIEEEDIFKALQKAANFFSETLVDKDKIKS